MSIKIKNGLLLLMCLFLGSHFLAFGQSQRLERPPNPKIRALKIQVVTKDMNLSVIQKKQFLPLYTAYSNELLVVYRQKHALKQDAHASSDFVVNERLRLDQQIVSIKEKYKSRFLDIISPEQLEEMYQGEDEFKQLLIQRLRHSHK